MCDKMRERLESDNAALRAEVDKNNDALECAMKEITKYSTEAGRLTAEVERLKDRGQKAVATAHDIILDRNFIIERLKKEVERLNKHRDALMDEIAKGKHIAPPGPIVIEGIPADFLKQHDAKVRAETFREVQHEYCEGKCSGKWCDDETTSEDCGNPFIKWLRAERGE